jgi:hypothetical protein
MAVTTVRGWLMLENAKLVPVGLIVLLTLTFVGDYTVFGVPAFYLCWLGVILFRVVARIRLTRSELIAQFVSYALFFPMLMPLMLQHGEKWDVYYHSFFFITLYINALPLLFWLFDRRKQLFWSALPLLCLFGVLSVLSLAHGYTRSRIVFGPNVLYRIYALLFAMLFVALAYGRRSLLRGTGIFFILGLLFVAMAGTGSRGAILVTAAIAVYLILFGGRFPISKTGFRLSVAAAAAGGILLARKVFTTYTARLFLFALSSNSTAARLSFYGGAADFLAAERGLKLLFGVGVHNAYFTFYPHNLLVEALVYGGLYRAVATVVLLVAMVVYVLRNGKSSWVVLVYSGIIIGSMVSGSTMDNYPVLSLAVFVLCSAELFWKRRPKVSAQTVPTTKPVNT